jgi:multiple sugar transport system ATP-binding protein
MAELLLTGVRKLFQRTSALDGIDLAAHDGEFLVVVGPSGCGKSTLLRIVAGLVDADAGDLVLDGERINALPPARRGVAMVFQSYALYPHMTAFENIAFGLKASQLGGESAADRIRSVAALLHIEHLLDRKPRDLSGGQRQRVAIGRAIARRPRLFLFDEPLSNLDAELRVEMRGEIARLHRELGATTIYVTHDQTEAMTLADRIVVLRDGRVAQIGAPLDLYHHPRDTFVAGFIGSPRMNLLESAIVGFEGRMPIVRLPQDGHLTVAVDGSGARAGDPVTLGLRPESLGEGRIGFEARLLRVEQLGSESYLYLDIGEDRPFVVRHAANFRGRIGEPWPVPVEENAAHLFDAEGRAFEKIDPPD